MNLTTRLRDQAHQEVAIVTSTLRTWPWLDTLKTLRMRFREDKLGVTASSLTFTTLISLVPLVTVMLALFSAFPIFSSFQGALEKYFLQSLVPDTIARPVLKAVTQFASKANQVGAVGLAALFLSALMLMLTIDRTLNAIWRVPRPRPMAQRVLVYWAAATLGPLLLGVSLSFTSYALSASRGLVQALPGGLNVVLNVLEFALLAVGMAGLFHYVPNTHVRWRHALAGGIFVSAGFEVAKAGLGWYLRTVPGLSVIYGAFATVPIFLVWMYLGWVIVLLGAVVAAYAPSLQMRVVRRAAVPGYRFDLSLAVLRSLHAARDAEPRGMRPSDLARELRADPLQLEPILSAFVALDWAGRLDEAGDARYVLLCDPACTPARPLIERMLLQTGTGTVGFWRRAQFDTMTLAEAMAPGPQIQL